MSFMHSLHLDCLSSPQTYCDSTRHPFKWALFLTSRFFFFFLETMLCNETNGNDATVGLKPNSTVWFGSNDFFFPRFRILCKMLTEIPRVCDCRHLTRSHFIVPRSVHGTTQVLKNHEFPLSPICQWQCHCLQYQVGYIAITFPPPLSLTVN